MGLTGGRDNEYGNNQTVTHQQFLGPEAAVTLRKQVSVILAPLANTVSWGSGTDKGPAAVIEASQALELFDDELLTEPHLAGIETLPLLDLKHSTSTQALEIICETVWHELQRNRLPLVIGGEHTVTVPAVSACARKYPDLHVVQIDAHLDLRDQYEDDPLSHACVMRRIHDLQLPFTQVGIRSFSREEWDMAQAHQLRPYFMHRIKNEADWIEQLCAGVNGPVYITFDVDGLDPAIMPATGTPEPDGLSWDKAMQLLKRLAKTKKIVGMDFVEFAPAPGAHHAAFTVAKLIYRTLGYIFPPQSCC